MILFIFGLVSIVILVPIIYLLPLGLSKKGKVIVLFTSAVVAIISLLSNLIFDGWQSILLLLLLVVVGVYIIYTRFGAIIFETAHATATDVANDDSDAWDAVSAEREQAAFHKASEDATPMFDDVDSDEELTEWMESVEPEEATLESAAITTGAPAATTIMDKETEESLTDESVVGQTDWEEAIEIELGGASPEALTSDADWLNKVDIVVEDDLAGVGGEEVDEPVVPAEIEEKLVKMEEEIVETDDFAVNLVDVVEDDELALGAEDVVEPSDLAVAEEDITEVEELALELEADDVIEPTDLVDVREDPMAVVEPVLEADDVIEPTDLADAGGDALEVEEPALGADGVIEPDDLVVAEEDPMESDDLKVEIEDTIETDVLVAEAEDWIETDEAAATSDGAVADDRDDLLPSEVERQTLATVLEQLEIARTRVDAAEFEQLVIGCLRPDLSAYHYYSFASLLIQHYLSTGEFAKLKEFLSQLQTTLNNYPIILEEIRYLQSVISGK